MPMEAGRAPAPRPCAVDRTHRLRCKHFVQRISDSPGRMFAARGLAVGAGVPSGTLGCERGVCRWGVAGGDRSSQFDPDMRGHEARVERDGYRGRALGDVEGENARRFESWL